MEIADLARADLDAVVVKLLAETEPRCVALVEPDRDDGAAPPHDAHRVPERRGAAGALEGDRDGLGTEIALQPRPNISSGGERLESD